NRQGSGSGSDAADNSSDWAPMCAYANDGECDEPEIGTGLCAPQSDTADCGADASIFSDVQQPDVAPMTRSGDAPMCEDMYASCQSTCGYFTGSFQWVTDYSCMAQCSFCHDSCVQGNPTACTNEFRPWG